LKGFSVADGNEIRFSDIPNDGDVGREVEVDWKRDEFLKGKKIFSFDIWYVKD
jgi:hypothetical protein